MAASSSAIAASKLLNLPSPALQSLIRRQILLHPASAAAAAAASPIRPDVHSLNLPHPEKGSATGSPNRYASRATELNLKHRPLGFSPMRIEAARTFVPKEEDYQDADEDDDIDDEYIDEEGDSAIGDHSGSDFDDGDDDCGGYGDGVVDKDP
ncbi:hypothetical protein OROGR_015348 [Orobanche gracilis]